ncbi:MAG TPA: hypothetical protein DCZ91_16390 [Lachnospiraceae bacterium]|nr:hypothetical protein [Lachnospiraceae bacterium]
MSEWVITSSILILLIIGIRACFRNKVALRARYALWLVVALRLLVPVSLSESSLSVLNFLNWEAEADGQAEVAAGADKSVKREEAALEDVLPEIFSGKERDAGRTDGLSDNMLRGSVENTGKASQKAEYSGTAGEATGHEGNSGSMEDMVNTWKIRSTGTVYFTWKTALCVLWLAGAVVMACIVLSVNISYRRRIYASRTRYRAGRRSGLPVYITPAVVTPCMFGLLHPAVYLTPGIERNAKALRYVLCHENTHYSHRDNLWALVRVICVCLHWYNPLVWIAAELSGQDCELACDERALQLLDEEERIDYGRTLLDFSVQNEALPEGLQLSTAVAGGKKQLKERLMMIVSRPRRSTGALALTFVFVMVVSASTFTGKVSGQEPLEKETQDAVPNGGVEGRSVADGGAEVGHGQNSIINTSIVAIDLNDGKDYTLKTVWEDEKSGEEYRIAQVELNWLHDKKEETLQVIRLEDVKVLYTISLEDIRKNDGRMWNYAPEKEVLYAKPLCTAEDLPNYAAESFLAEGSGSSLAELCDGSILAVDLNFDGYQDFCLRGKGDGDNIPYYCYLWNPEEEQFEPGYMVPNICLDEEGKLIESATIDGDYVRSVKFYRFDGDNTLHMTRYVEENHSQDAVLPALDLTYCETGYSLPAVDEWDYGTRYGGALTERFILLAKDALTELYEWSGTRLETVSFSVMSGGEVVFGNTSKDVAASRVFYSRCYGERAGFEKWIPNMLLSTERVVWYSPVTQWNVPENLAQMTDEEVILWYFARSAVAEGEAAETIERSYEDSYVVKTESGNYYEIDLEPSTREVCRFYGPYDKYPVH